VAEASWPGVMFGKTINGIASTWLNKYLIPKIVAEGRLGESNKTKGMIRLAIYSLLLIWN
jgi:hypothetical protein